MSNNSSELHWGRPKNVSVEMTEDNEHLFEFKAYRKYGNHADVAEMVHEIRQGMANPEVLQRWLNGMVYSVSNHPGDPTFPKDETVELMERCVDGPMVWCDTDTSATIEELAKEVPPLEALEQLVLPGPYGTVLFEQSITEDISVLEHMPSAEIGAPNRKACEFAGFSWCMIDRYELGHNVMNALGDEMPYLLLVMPWTRISYKGQPPLLTTTYMSYWWTDMQWTHEADKASGIAPWMSPRAHPARVIAALSAYCAGTVEVTDQPIPRPTRRKTQRKGSNRSTVSVIRMRQTAPVPEDHEPVPTGKTGKITGKRWTVRGHFRQQPCGPARSQRRTVWIAPHVKGEVGAPITQVQKLWKVDR